jgi:hypothetical protein
MEIKDLTGLSKPLTRLIEVIASGIGAVSRPYLTRRNAEAKAHEIAVIAGALKSAADLHGVPAIFKDGEVEAWRKPEDNTLILADISGEERSERRVEYQERKRQNNVERITSIAATELLSETEVPNESPDEDWICRFFNSAQDVSSEQMQELWGRILSGEIKRPGSFSLKTLDFVRNMTKHDAELIQLLAPLTVKVHNSYVIPIPDKAWLEANRSVYPSHHFAGGELGALYPTDLQNRFFFQPEQTQAVFTSGDRLLLIDRHEVTSELQLPIWKYTQVGSELIDLIAPEPDIDHLRVVGDFFVKRKAQAKIARIIDTLPDGRIRFKDAEEIRAPEGGA